MKAEVRQLVTLRVVQPRVEARTKAHPRMVPVHVALVLSAERTHTPMIVKLQARSHLHNERELPVVQPDHIHVRACNWVQSFVAPAARHQTDLVIVRRGHYTYHCRTAMRYRMERAIFHTEILQQKHKFTSLPARAMSLPT